MAPVGLVAWAGFEPAFFSVLHKHNLIGPLGGIGTDFPRLLMEPLNH